MEERPTGDGSFGTQETGNYQAPAPGGDIGTTPAYGGGSAREIEKKKNAGKGWLFGMGCVGCGLLGCLGTIVLICVLFVGVIMWFKGNILSDQALEIPPTYLTEAETVNLEAKLKAFNKELSKKTGMAVPLQLSIKELNYYAQKSSAETKIKMYAEADTDDKIDFKASIPMGEATPIPYMNWSGKGEFSVKKGKFEAKFDSLTIGKTAIPGGDFLKGFSEGIGEELNNSPAFKKLPVTIETMTVEKGIINLELKTNTPTPETEPSSKPE